MVSWFSNRPRQKPRSFSLTGLEVTTHSTLEHPAPAPPGDPGREQTLEKGRTWGQVFIRVPEESALGFPG